MTRTDDVGVDVNVLKEVVPSIVLELRLCDSTEDCVWMLLTVPLAIEENVKRFVVNKLTYLAVVPVISELLRELLVVREFTCVFLLLHETAKVVEVELLRLGILKVVSEEKASGVSFERLEIAVEVARALSFVKGLVVPDIPRISLVDAILPVEVVWPFNLPVFDNICNDEITGFIV